MAGLINIYSSTPVGKRGAVASTGALGDTFKAAADMPAGVFVVADVQASAGGRVGKVPAASAELSATQLLGLAVLGNYRAPSEVDPTLELVAGRLESFMKRGEAWAVCEASTMTQDRKVYVRHTANGVGKLQLGAVRGDSDGGNVFTVNTATSTSEYVLALDGVTFKFTSDGTATVNEIAIGLAAQIDAHADFIAPVPGGAAFTVTRVNGIEPVATALDSRISTGATCRAIEGARFASSASAAGIVKVELNLTA